MATITGALAVTEEDDSLNADASRAPFTVRGAGKRARRIARNLRLQKALDATPLYRSRTTSRPKILTERNRGERTTRRRDRRQFDSTINARMFTLIDPNTFTGDPASTTVESGTAVDIEGTPYGEAYWWRPGYGP